MNIVQRRTLLAGAIVLLLSCLFVPWYAEDDGGFIDYGYAWFFSGQAVYLDINRLYVEWVAVVAATAAAWLAARPVVNEPYRRRFGSASGSPTDVP